MLYLALLPPIKEEVNAFPRVCLSVRPSVCVLARLLNNASINLDEMLRIDRCRDMDEPINFWARSGLESGCRNRIAFSAIVQALLGGILRRENPTYTYWPMQRGVVLKCFYGPPLQRRVVVQWFCSRRPSKQLRYMRSTECPSSFIHRNRFKTHYFRQKINLCLATHVIWREFLSNTLYFTRRR